MKYLGIFIDDHLTFIPHVNTIIKRCDSKLFLMRQLKKLGMSSTGLCNFYFANIRSVLCYGAPVFFIKFYQTPPNRSWSMFNTLPMNYFPHAQYCDRLDMLDMISLDDSIIRRQSTTHFSKVANSCAHSLHDKIIFNNSRRSSRCHTVFRPK